MEDISRDMDREIESGPSETDFSKRARQWDILIVKDDGKVISVPWFRKIIIGVFFLFSVVILLSLMMFVMYRSVLTEKKELYASLERSMERTLSLQADIDKKMEKLEEMEKINSAQALAQRGAAGTGGGDQVKKETGNTTPTDVQTAGRPKNDTSNDIIEASSEDAGAEANLANSPVSGKNEKTMAPVVYKIELEDFSATWKAYNNSLRIWFVIKNISEKEETLSGHIFVILKSNDLDEKEWVPYPAVQLVSGKPGESRKGQFFSIRRFKSVRFIVTDPLDYTKLKKATVFVYSNSGGLILEQDFALNVAAE